MRLILSLITTVLVSAHRERQRWLQVKLICTSIIKNRIILCFTPAVGVSGLSSSVVHTISTLSPLNVLSTSHALMLHLLSWSPLWPTPRRQFLIRQVRRDQGLKRVDLNRGGSCTVFYTDGCDALMQINFLHSVGSFNKMLSSARRLTIWPDTNTYMLRLSHKPRQFLPCLACVFSVTVSQATCLVRQNPLYIGEKLDNSL